MPRAIPFQEAKRRSILKHGDKYGYERAEEEFKSMSIKVNIYCKFHNQYFLQDFHHHIRGHGCHECGKIKAKNFHTLPVEVKIKQAEEVHGDKYGYEKVPENYKTVRSKVPIYCKFHGEYFIQDMFSHCRGNGCPECGKIANSHRFRANWEDVEKKCRSIHGDYYDYSEFEFVNYHVPSTIICPKHGRFQQRMANHTSNEGCPCCNNKTEGLLKVILLNNFNYEIIHDRGFDWCKKEKKLRYDFIIEDLKCIIELDGRQHFEDVSRWASSSQEQLENDIFKNKQAMKNGYTVIRVDQRDIYNNKKDIILKLIMSVHRYETPQLICIGDSYQNRFN
jgi:very-short-patch-repair endonuclease